MNDNQGIISILSLISTGALIATFLAAIGLFFAFVFIRKPKKDISLFPINARQDLSNNEAKFFAYIKYNPDVNAIVLKQQQVFKKCVVTLIYRKNGKLGMKKHNLTYKEGDLFCAIPVENDVEEYKVVLESVDKRIKKHAPIDNYLVFNIIYAVIVAVLFVIGMFLYVAMCSYYLKDYWVGYATYYGLTALVIIYLAIVIGGCILGDVLAKKGVF